MKRKNLFGIVVSAPAILPVLTARRGPEDSGAGASPEPALTSVSAVSRCLAGASGGTAANPVSLRAALALADGANGWAALLGAIQSAGKYVSLNLSACTGMTAFAPGRADTGERYIVSLTLPDRVSSLPRGEYDRNNYFYTAAFEYFSSLKSVSGSGVTAVGENVFGYNYRLETIRFPAAISIDRDAFATCTSITSIEFPAATSIGERAFGNLDSLSLLTLPRAETIGDGAFDQCVSLISLSLPAAKTIGEGAFANCNDLQTVNLPLVTRIGGQAFYGSGSTALTVTLGAAPPSVGKDMFKTFASDAKYVTVRVPSGSVSAYNASWQRAFKGAGGNAAAADGGGAENTNITLTIIGF